MRRRGFIEGSGWLGALSMLPGTPANAQTASQTPPQARTTGKTFVLVHGAWHGAWTWERIAPHLRAAGHDVRALTLSGVGERIGEISTRIDLETHIGDVVSFVRTQDLRGVVLVGHSYGGYPVTAAAERLGAEGRIDAVAYLDAFVPRHGERMLDYLDADGRRQLESAHRAGNAHWPRLPAKFFGLSNQADIDYVDAHLTDHPNGTYLQPIRLAHPPAGGIRRRIYIASQAPALTVLDSQKEHLRRDEGWHFAEIQAGHDAMVDQPEALARLLLAAL